VDSDNVRQLQFQARETERTLELHRKQLAIAKQSGRLKPQEIEMWESFLRIEEDAVKQMRELTGIAAPKKTET
jgi:hypothetical protein